MSGHLQDVLADEVLDIGYVRLIKLEMLEGDEDEDRPYTLDELRAMEFLDKVAVYDNHGQFVRSYAQQLSVEAESRRETPLPASKTHVTRQLSVLPTSGAMRKPHTSSVLPLSRHASRAPSVVCCSYSHC